MNPVRPLWFYGYVLKNKVNDNFYIGVASDLKHRLEQHNKGLVRSTKRLRHCT